MFTRISLKVVFLIFPVAVYAGEGKINFSGTLLEPTCEVKMSESKFFILTSCSRKTADSALLKHSLSKQIHNVDEKLDNKIEIKTSPALLWGETLVIYQ